MKNKIAVIAVIAFIAVILTLPCFAFNQYEYAPIFQDLSTNSYIQGRGMWGGLYTDQGQNGIYGIGYGTYGSAQKDGLNNKVRYTMYLEPLFDNSTTWFYIPYATSRYVTVTGISFHDYNLIPAEAKDYKDYVISYTCRNIELDFVEYDVHYNTDPLLHTPAKYTYEVESNLKAVQVIVTMNVPADNKPIPVTVELQFTDVPGPSVIDQSTIMDNLGQYLNNNQSNTNTIFGYLNNLWSYSYIQLLITLSVLLAVIAILFNWGVSL